MPFDPVDPKQSFPALEHGILEFWEKENTFRRSMKARRGCPVFRFYDGPPFATGLPHYGHLLAGTIKDVIPRYQTMRGKFVERRFGWDCHGLPVEYEIEKEHGIKGKKDIETMGIAKFNALCRSAVQRYTKEWQTTVERMGRWVDMDWDYRTMDPDYMESIWWVFKELWDKRLIAEGHKPMHVCPRCVTPLSNFEVTQGYKEVTDIGVVVKFALEPPPLTPPPSGGEGNSPSPGRRGRGLGGGGFPTYLLAWTTTPWTLPGNQFLAVKPRVQYVRVAVRRAPHPDPLPVGEGNTPHYIVAKKCVERIFAGKEYEIIGKPFTSQELVGKRYEPVFPYFACHPEPVEGQRSTSSTVSHIRRAQCDTAFRIVAADFVTTDEGTGIVHIAPGFGEDDYRVWERETQAPHPNPLPRGEGPLTLTLSRGERGCPLLQHVTMDGHFTEAVTDFAGMEVKPKDDSMKTDRKIVEHLEEKGLVFSKELVRHSYPHCWRCDTPLLNYATSSWFVKVEKIKEDLLTANQETEWVPAHLRDGRFGKWLEGARDWAISRQRYWGTPLPIWRNTATKDLTVISSRDDLITHCKIRFTKVTVLRHGESEGNIRHIYQGDVPGTSLTEEGKRQAEATGETLRSAPVAAIYTSPLARTRETAAIISLVTGAPIIVDDRLRESGFGSYEGKPIGPDERAFLRRTRRDHLRNPKNPDHRSQAAGMELWAQVEDRVQAFFSEILPRHRSDHIIIVSHADTIQNITHFFTKEDPLHIEKQPFPVYAHPRTFFHDHDRAAAMDLHRDNIDDIVWPGSPSVHSLDLTLVRHGETDWNKENKSQGGQSDIPLNAEGRKQAHALAKKLGGKYDVIISSDLTRAVETAQILSEELGIPFADQWDILRERHTGDWGGLSYDAILEKHPTAHTGKGTTTFHHETPVNGESLSAFLHRAWQVYEKLLCTYPGKRVLCVSHGGMIRALRTICENLPYRDAASWHIGNAETVSLQIHPLLRRIPDVLDCWFESGAMPYAVQGGFPADFIAENLDQTRGWFYTLMVLATALFQKPAFRHCICGGMILAEDGKKMSKRLKNYPDPTALMDHHGADALRFMLMTSPVVRAEEIRFSEHTVEDVVRSVLLPLWNAYSFFVTYANLAHFEPQPTPQSSDHPLDQWIRAELQDLTNRMTEELDRYDLSRACGELLETIDALTNWYIRLSRRRFAGKDPESEPQAALGTLYDVLLTLQHLLAPFCPFITEAIARNLAPGIGNSVHLTDWPLPRPLTAGERSLLQKNRVLRSIVSLGLRARAEAGVKLRQPLASAHIAIPPALLPLHALHRNDELLLQQELNVQSIALLTDPGTFGKRIALVDARKAGPRLGARVQEVINAGKRGEFEEREDGSFRILDELLTPEEVHITYQGKEGENIAAERGVVLRIDTRVSKALHQEGCARDLIRAVQRLRKDAGLQLPDRITLQIDGVDDILSLHKDLIEQETRATMGKSDGPALRVDIDAHHVTIRFTKVVSP